MTTLRLRQHKSAIGEKAAAKGTLSALGLGKPGAEAAFEDSATVRGMIRRVAYLVEVTETNGDEGTPQANSGGTSQANSGDTPQAKFGDTPQAKSGVASASEGTR